MNRNLTTILTMLMELAFMYVPAFAIESDETDYCALTKMTQSEYALCV